MSTLLAVLAHPDDESMGTGGLIIRHTRNDVTVHLVCATHGEQGSAGKPPGARREDLADIRAAELEAAAACAIRTLGQQSVAWQRIELAQQAPPCLQ